MSTQKRSLFPVVAIGRRARLSRGHFTALFGADRSLTRLVDLDDEGLFAALETITLKGPAGVVVDVRVVGPEVESTSVDLPIADFATLGLTAPSTRRVDGSPGALLEGPVGSVMIAEGILPIVRHLRVSRDLHAELLARARVSLRIEGDRARVLSDVAVTPHEDRHADVEAVLVVDTDDANALELAQNTRAVLTDS